MKEVISRNLDHAYDKFLTGREAEMTAAIRDFEERRNKSRLKFGKFPMPSYFKPHFVTAGQEKLVTRMTDQLIGILDKVVRLYFETPLVSQLFSFSEEAKSLIRVDPGYSRNVVVARFDSLLEGEKIKLIELNTGSPAGMGYSDLWDDLFLETPQLKDFFAEHALRRETRCEKLLEVFLSCYEEFGGSEKPQIAIVDWKTVQTLPEFEIVQEVFERKGYKTIIADPRDLTFKQGKLYLDDFRIDLLYCRAIFSEIMEKLSEVRDFIRAYKARAVCVVNPLRSVLAGDKAVLSLLSTPAYDEFFTDEENQLKAACIPWTRRVTDVINFYGEKKSYMINLLKDEKDTLVLKPCLGYGGKDVFIGSETTDMEWNRVIDRALKENWVAQEFIPAPIMTVPVAIHNQVDFLYRRVNFSSFAFGGRYVSGFSRLSESSVITVARNGGLVSCIGVEQMHQR